jgi:hypothetical protein
MVGVRSRLVLGVVVVVVLGVLGVASSASASNPYSVFEQCPTNVPGVRFCLYGTVTSGEFAIGSTRVPIDKTIVIQDGALPTEPSEASGAYYVIPAKNGDSLSKTELEVPGGLFGLTHCETHKGGGVLGIIFRYVCEAERNSNLNTVTATTEGAANLTDPAILSLHNLFAEQESALTLPVKIHLQNALLGKSCYIGSEASPILLHLTTGVTSPPGPNKPIGGLIGGEGEEGEGDITTVHPLRLVDNAFSVPTAEGCGELLSFKGFLDTLVDSEIGLEANAGSNTAILEGEQKITTVTQLEKHL